MSSDEEDMIPGNARKRRKLNTPLESSSESTAEPSSDSPQSLHEETGARENSEPRQQQRPRHKIHIVQNTDTAEDEFLSQLPTATEYPHRIRGAYWLKRAPQPPPPPQLEEPPDVPEQTAVSVREPNEPVSRRHVTAAPRKTYDILLQQPPEPEAEIFPEHDDIEAALMEELAGFHDEFETPDQPMGKASEVITIPSQNVITSQDLLAMQQHVPRLAAPRNNLRQTTLFGQAVRDDGTATQASQSSRARNFPVANRDEPPTHHKLDHEALKTWVYPTNLGLIRDYQYTIVGRGLYSNLLVALPTGLGKTFIAATVMLNWFRWTKDAQIVFVAPTRPLVAQQVDACFHIAGIPRSATTLLTGQTPPALRAEEWETKRVFFMTPQTIINDLKTGICDPKKIVLVVVDEAHRATGNYAYVEMVTFLRRFNTSFRVLALTATPGSTVESVQQVIDGLGIARTEIRTEESLDIRQYVHQRNIDTMLFDFSEEIEIIMDLLSNAIRPVLQKLTSCNAYWSKDPMALTAYGCTIARQKWMNTAGRTANHGLKGMVNSIFSILAGIAHSIELLKFHGVGPFYHKIMNPSNKDKKESKYETQIRDHADFKKMMSTMRAWTNNPDFLGHPKLEHLSSVVLNHFIDAGEGCNAGAEAAPSATKIMIFAHYRDSAEEIVRVLNRHKPLVRPHVFVGQAATGASEGMDQKKQTDIIEKFKKGTYNTLVATSIGEEGLDIGEVDLIICYDASASPIRMLQRMGRTGRKRAGNICVLLMKKKEQDNFEKAKDNYEKMQKMIELGDRFTYHLDQSPRIVPRDVKPEVDKRVVEIPIENSQSELPEPKKRKGKLPKKPPKKFHMPDGVITGFRKASDMEGGTKGEDKQRARSPTLDPVPEISTVLLSDAQNLDLERRYLFISGEQSEVVEYPSLDRFPSLNLKARPTRMVGHGKAARNMIQMLNKFADIEDSQRYRDHLHPEDRDLADKAWKGEAPVELDMSDTDSLNAKLISEDEPDETPKPIRKRKIPAKKKYSLQQEVSLLDGMDHPAESGRKRRTSAKKKASYTKVSHLASDNDPDQITQPGRKRKAPAKQKSLTEEVALVPEDNDSNHTPKTGRKRKTTVKKRKQTARKNQRDQMEASSAPPSPTPLPSSNADVGIDIMNTDDDNDPDDDDDDGSDLIDFIDDAPQLDLVPSSSAADSLLLESVSRRKRKNQSSRPEVESGSDKDNDSLSDADNLLASSASSQPVMKRRRQGRRMVVDSEED